MIIDSSVLVAMLRNEPDASVWSAAIESGGAVAVSTASYLETSIVVTATSHGRLDQLLAEVGADIVAFDAEQSRIARDAYATYGKGSGSPARLNFGDCMAYALAKVAGEPLLFKGNDFTHTDITPALPPS